MCYTPLGRFPKLDCSTTKRVPVVPIPNDIYAFGKFSLGDIFPMQTFFFFGTGGTIPTAVEISTMEDRPRGGVVYTVVCVTAVVLSCTQPTGSGAQFFSNVGFGENRSEDGQSREYVHRSQGAKGRVLHTKP